MDIKRKEKKGIFLSKLLDVVRMFFGDVRTDLFFFFFFWLSWVHSWCCFFLFLFGVSQKNF